MVVLDYKITIRRRRDVISLQPSRLGHGTTKDKSLNYVLLMWWTGGRNLPFLGWKYFLIFSDKVIILWRSLHRSRGDKSDWPQWLSVVMAVEQGLRRGNFRQINYSAWHSALHYIYFEERHYIFCTTWSGFFFFDNKEALWVRAAVSREYFCFS